MTDVQAKDTVRDDSERDELWHHLSPWIAAARQFQSTAGVKVTAETLLRHTPVYAALQLLGGDIGASEVKLHSVETSDLGVTRTPVFDHPGYELAALMPHALMLPCDFWEATTISAMIWGNQIIEVPRDGFGMPLTVGEGGGLILHNMDRAEPWYDDNGSLWIRIWERLVDKTIKPRLIDPEDTIHVRNLTTNGFWGRGLKDVARDRIGGGYGMMQQGNRFMANGMQPDWFFSTEEELDEEEYNLLVARLKRDNKGIDNTGQTLLLDRGLKPEQVGLSFRNAQFVQLQELDVKMVSLLTGIPAVLLNSMAAATFSNVEELYTLYVNRVLRRWANKIAQELRRKLLRFDEFRTHEFSHDLDPLLRGKMSERFASWNQALAAMWMTKNEVRAEEGRNPVKNGDTFENPNTTSDRNSDDDQVAPDEPENEETMRRRAALLTQLMRHEDQAVADGIEHRPNSLEFLDTFYKSGGFEKELAELCPRSAADYCTGRFNMLAKVGNHVETPKAWANVARALTVTQPDRVASLLTAESFR